METQKKTSVENNPAMPTYEQLAQLNQILQQKCVQAEQGIQQLNNVFTRLNYLFDVLDRAQYFSEDFVNACSEEIQNLLDVRQVNEEVGKE